MRWISDFSPSADAAVTHERFDVLLYGLDGVLTGETRIHAEMLQ